MKDTAHWTEDKIEILKIAFLQGNKLKHISQILGKSSSALNKALCRFGIRLPKINPQYIEWLPDDPCYQSKIPSFISFRKKKTDASAQKRQCFKETRVKIEDNSVWVELLEVVRYLQGKNIHLTQIEKPLVPQLFSEAQFLLNHKPVTALQLLLVANELRIEEKQPIFLISEVSW
jgi:hypothetical protein